VNEELDTIKNKVKLSNQGVGVAASTLGSLEALLAYLQKENIPVSNVSVGPVSKEDINKAMRSLLAEDPNKRKKE
jgi:translation initiation factor 5B